MNRNRTLVLFVVLTFCLLVAAQTGTQSQTGTSQTTTPSSPGMQQPHPSTSGSTSQSGMSQSSSSQGMSQMGGGTEQQIRSLEEQLRQSALRNDPSFIDQHGTSDYVSIGAGGRQMGKSEVVQSLRSGDIHYQSIEPIGTPTVRIFGDSAIVNGEAAVRLTSFGQAISGNFRYTRVWVRQGGDWKVASFESTPEQPTSR